MAGFRGGDGDAHRFRIAHLAYHQNIRGLAKCCAESRRKIRRVRADFNLLDDASNVGVLVLDRVFDGDNVSRFAAVDVVDQCGERGRFTRARGTANQDQAARQMCEGFHGREG